LLLASLLLLGAGSKAGTAPAPAGDANAGAVVYQRCLACHALEYNRTGPRHCGLLGRRAGSVKDFQYSAAMRKSRLVWNRKTLDRFLSGPTKLVPGTLMTYAGVDDAKERADLIAYLAAATRDPKICKP
jgi:cytochrome c